MFAMLGGTEKPGSAAHRNFGIAAQRVTEPVEGVAPVADATENASPNQHSHQPAHAVGVRVDRSGQLVCPQRPVHQRVGDAQIGRGGNGLRRPALRHQFHHHGGRRSHPLVQPSDVMTGTVESPSDFKCPNVGRKHKHS